MKINYQITVPDKRLIDIGDNLKISTKITGDLTNPTILFANGSVFNYKQFDHAMIPKLLDHTGDSYSIVQYDYVGIGNSSNLDDQFDFVTLADQQASLIRALELDSVHLFGYSKGSIVSQIMTAKYPELVLSLVGLGSPNLANEDFLRVSKREFSLRYQNSEALKGIWLDKIDDKNFKMVYDSIFVPSIFSKEVFQLGIIEKIKNWWIRKRLGPFLKGTLIENLSKLYKYYTREISEEEKERYIDAVKSIEAPTLLIHGTADERVPISSSRELEKLIQSSKLVQINKLSHSEPLLLGKKASQVMKIYSGFLEEINSAKE